MRSRARRSLAARWVVVFAVLSGLGIASAQPSYAHASLVDLEPAADSLLSSAPPLVRLRFTESVDARLGGVRVFEPGGERVDAGTAASHDGGRVVEARFDGKTSGTYTVAWRVTSDDGHPIAGTFVFSLRQRSEPTTIDNQTPAATEAAAGIGRWALYLSAFALIGLAIASLTAVGSTQGAASRLSGAGVAAALGLAVAAALALLGEAGRATGRGPFAALSTLPTFVTGRTGALLALRLVVVVLGAAVLTGGRSRRALSGLAGIVTGGVVLILTSLGGHATTTSPAAFAVLADIAHLAAAATWVGGLVAALAVRTAAGAGWAAHLRGFSRRAAWAFAAVVVTGAVSTWFQARTISGVRETSWGEALQLKVVLVAALAALGAFNRRRLLPARRLAALREVLRVEVAIAVLALAATTVLVARPPGRTAAERRVSVEGTTPAGQVFATLEPARVGTNELHLYFLTATGAQRPVDAVEVGVATGDLPTRAATVTAVSASHYGAYGLVFPTAGRWTVRVAEVTDGVVSSVDLAVEVS